MIYTELVCGKRQKSGRTYAEREKVWGLYMDEKEDDDVGPPPPPPAVFLELSNAGSSSEGGGLLFLDAR
nr:hypothetical protein Itr_chr09CG01710 [Ipomoea trifida]